MPVSMGLTTDSRRFSFVRELLTALARPTDADLDRIERSVRVGFMQNFARERVAGGSPWAPLAARTRRERAFQGYPASNPILRRSGAYAASWARLGGWRMLERTIKGWTLHVASDHRWAFSHELGVRSRNLPARPVRYLDSGQHRVIASQIEAWVDSVIRRVMT